MLSRVQLVVTLWTVVRQALPSWDFPGKNTGVGCHFPSYLTYILSIGHQRLV